MGLTLISGFAMATFFIFIASASFVYTSEFGPSPTGFSLAFALNAIGFFGALATRRLPSASATAWRRVILRAVTGFRGSSWCCSRWCWRASGRCR